MEEATGATIVLRGDDRIPMPLESDLSTLGFQGLALLTDCVLIGAKIVLQFR